MGVKGINRLCRDGEVAEKGSRSARVFSENAIDASQRGECAFGNIAQISDRGCNDVKRTAHRLHRRDLSRVAELAFQILTKAAEEALLKLAHALARDSVFVADLLKR